MAFWTFPKTNPKIPCESLDKRQMNIFMLFRTQLKKILFFKLETDKFNFGVALKLNTGDREIMVRRVVFFDQR